MLELIGREAEGVGWGGRWGVGVLTKRSIHLAAAIEIVPADQLRRNLSLENLLIWSPSS